MMQMKDYKKARQYYTDAIENMHINSGNFGNDFLEEPRLEIGDSKE